ncbi:MAG: hypothetical protein ABW123_11645 [Cystobacter sp.]
MNDGQTLQGVLLTTLYTVLALGVLGAGSALTWWLAVKAKDSKVLGVVSRAWEVALSTVAFVESRIRPQVAASLADGKLTADEVKGLQAAAVAAFKDAMGEKGLADLKKVLGLSDTGLEGHIGGLLERAFQFFKLTKASAAAPPAVAAAGNLAGAVARALPVP